MSFLKGKNIIADGLFVTALIVLVLGIIGSCILGDQLRIGYGGYNVTIFLTGALSSVIFSLTLFGLGEIINILCDNRTYLKKLAESTTDLEQTDDTLPDL